MSCSPDQTMKYDFFCLFMNLFINQNEFGLFICDGFIFHSEISWPLKFIYSEKATKFCEIFTLHLSYVVPVKSKVKILQNFVAFSKYMNFNKRFLLLCHDSVSVTWKVPLQKSNLPTANREFISKVRNCKWQNQHWGHYLFQVFWPLPPPCPRPSIIHWPP